MAERLITPEAVLSYPHLLVPQAVQEGQDAKYSASLVFLPDAQKTAEFKALKKGVLAVMQEKWGAGITSGKKKISFEQAIKLNILRTPFRDDAEAKGYPEGSVFLNVRTTLKPGVVGAYQDPATGKARVMTDQEITEKMYPGAIVRASITPFAYDVQGNKGGSFGLNNLQWLRDGERLDSFVAADAEFDAEMQEPADLSDLEEGTQAESEEEDGLADLL